MNHSDIQSLMRGIAPVLRDQITAAVGSFVERIAVLEAREPVKGEQGEKGQPGPAPEIEVVRSVVLDTVQQQFDGEFFRREFQGNLSALTERLDAIDQREPPNVEAEVVRVFETLKKQYEIMAAHINTLADDLKQAIKTIADLPPPKPGRDAEPVTRELTIDALRAMPELPEMVETVVSKHLADNPPKDGQPGSQGERGLAGEPGRDGRDGLPGVPGLKGVDGRDGQDGLGFEDMAVEYDGERTLNFKWNQGERVKEYSFSLPIPIDRAVWKQGEWKRGDGVSYGGSWFIAQCDTVEQPEKSRDWRLAAKRGRDGKDGKVEAVKQPAPIALK